MGKRDYKYKKIEGKNEIMILKYEGHETNLSIPGYIGEYPVTQIEDFAFEEWLTGFEETMIWFADYSEPDISKLLITINIPYTIKIIKSNAFVCCKYLVNINVDNYNDYFSSQDGILYNKDCTMIIKYPS